MNTITAREVVTVKNPVEDAVMIHGRAEDLYANYRDLPTRKGPLDRVRTLYLVYGYIENIRKNAFTYGNGVYLLVARDERYARFKCINPEDTVFDDDIVIDIREYQRVSPTAVYKLLGIPVPVLTFKY